MKHAVVIKHDRDQDRMGFLVPIRRKLHTEETDWLNLSFEHTGLRPFFLSPGVVPRTMQRLSFTEGRAICLGHLYLPSGRA